MGQVFYIAFIFFLSVLAGLTLLFLVVSIYENEKQAVVRSLAVLFVEVIVLWIVFYVPFPSWLYFCLAGLVICFLGLVLARFKTPDYIPAYSKQRIDERDTMFSRILLKKGSQRYTAYYSAKPEYKTSDDSLREKPGLLDKKSKFYNPFFSEAAKATFETVESLQGLVEKPANRTGKSDINPIKLTVFILNWAKKSGATSCGITEMKPYHLYSFIGRGADYGKKVALNHKYAIAFTVEMDKEFLSHAPFSPAVLESSTQYLNAGAIAVNIAGFIRNHGYNARAHIDANYRIICPLVAQDAGLGAIGRMGLLITPGLGPRVRIGVVTTDMPLNVTPVKTDGSVVEFCRICEKCARICPSKAIPFNGKKLIDGIERWKIDSEACYSYWCDAGTDCGRCINVCPFSHPDNFFHNLVRSAIRRNPLNRWIALKLESFFYGMKSKPVKLSGWMKP